MKTFSVEATVFRGSKSPLLVELFVDAVDESTAVIQAHKNLDTDGVDKVGRNIVRVRPVHALNYVSLSTRMYGNDE